MLKNEQLGSKDHDDKVNDHGWQIIKVLRNFSFMKNEKVDDALNSRNKT